MNKMLYLIYLIHTRQRLTQDNMVVTLDTSNNTIKKWIANEGSLFQKYLVKISREGSPRRGRYVVADWGVLNSELVNEYGAGIESKRNNTRRV